MSAHTPVPNRKASGASADFGGSGSGACNGGGSGQTAEGESGHAGSGAGAGFVLGLTGPGCLAGGPRSGVASVARADVRPAITS